MGTLRLGGRLQNILEPPAGTPPIMPAPSSAPAKRSRGQMIAGILSDAVKGFLGQPGAFGATLAVERQRQQDMDAAEAQWSRRRQAVNQDWVQRQQYEAAHPGPSPMARDVQAWLTMTPEQRAAYEAMQDAQRGPFTLLPNGQIYARDPALLAQITGAQAQPPVRNLGPMVDTIPGGGASNGAGGFPR